MAEPVLVVDFGTSSSAAAVVLDRGERLVKEPSSGLLSWPSAVCADGDRLLVGSAAEHRKRAEPSCYRAEFKRDLGERAPVPLGDRPYPVSALVAAVLAEFRSQGQVMIGRGIDRLVVTVPASYGPIDPRREAMLAAGAAAGFRSVELLAEPVAAAHATVAGEPFTPGETVLVYDFGGGTFDTALVRIGPDGASHTVLGHAALDDCGGRDIDALLAGRIRERGRDWLEPLLGAGGAGALRAQLELGDFVRRIKHQLTESALVEDYLTPLGRWPTGWADRCGWSRTRTWRWCTVPPPGRPAPPTVGSARSGCPPTPGRSPGASPPRRPRSSAGPSPPRPPIRPVPRSARCVCPTAASGS